MEWTDRENRIAVVALHLCGMKNPRIYDLLKPLKITRIFVYRTVKLYQETGSVKDRQRSGRPHSVRTQRVIDAVRTMKVCPHAGGVGLCEMVQHLQMWDYTSQSGTMESRMIEYVDRQHEHFVNPNVVVNAHYLAPMQPEYNTEFLESTIQKYEYPNGTEWQRMFIEGIFKSPEKLSDIYK